MSEDDPTAAEMNRDHLAKMIRDLPLRAACIHGRYERHEVEPNVGVFYDDRSAPCPGGREVTINREAAARQLAEALQRWGIRLSDETFQIDKWADSVVDAALGESDG